MCHHGKSSIFLVKGNNFGLLIDLDLREAALGVEEVGYSFHERPARLLVLGASLFVRIVSTEPIGLGFNTLFNRLVDLKDVDARSSARTCYHMQARVEHDLGNRAFIASTLQLL